ncbi:hypothetical protein V6N11_032922 [Hibiscus sabdariffa]|uniref:RNase H type-1 domain-containing protein n=1 Tax=Hibiscus sabdariffa TaxID=183260 RepID=A0ABR2NCC7_9ROSI
MPSVPTIGTLPAALDDSDDVVVWRCTPTSIFTIASAYARDLEPMWEGVDSKWFHLWSLLVTEHSNLHSSFSLSSNSTPWRCFFPSLLWQLWKRRNEFVFNASWLPLVEAYRISITWAAYFADIRASARTLPTSTFVYHQWKKPAMGWLCLNTDASISSADGVGTIGGVLRDSSGTWLRGYCKCIGKVSTIQAELWSVYIGLEVDWSFGTNRLVIQSDSSQAIKLVLDPFALRHSMQLVRAIAAWRLKHWSLDFQWILEK